HARHAHVAVIAVAIPRTTRIAASSAPDPPSGLPSPRASIQSGRHAVRAVARASRAASPVFRATAWCGAGVVDICWFSLAGKLSGQGQELPGGSRAVLDDVGAVPADVEPAEDWVGLALWSASMSLPRSRLRSTLSTSVVCRPP